MSKIIKFMVITLLLLASLALSFEAGRALGTRPPPSQGLDSVEQAWNIIFRDYVDKGKLDASALSQAAIEGMVEALDDPYTSYLDAQTYQLSLSDLAGEFGGIGAYVGLEDEQIIITAPIPGSPADKAGIIAS